MHTDDERFASTLDGTRLSVGGSIYSDSAAHAPTPEGEAPSPWALSHSGLKPISRLSSDARMARIIPDSHHRHMLRYCSTFARNFIRSDYNFCAAKMTVARGGKVRAIEQAFKSAEEWYSKALAWLLQHAGRESTIHYSTIEVEIPTALAGRLIRLLNEYDNVWRLSMGSVMSELLQPEARQTLLLNAEKRLAMIRQACIPDTDRFDRDGTLLED